MNIEVDCGFCKCKVRKCRWGKHRQTMKHTEMWRFIS